MRTARPRQWTKNLLVAAAPAAAGVLTEGDIAWRVAVGFVLFCLASSGGYFINDAVDATADRVHPVKSQRPVAAGLIAVPVATGSGVLLIAGAVAGALLLGPPAFAAAVMVYLLLTVAYSTWLKQHAILDIVVLAGGFVVRAVAGGVLAQVPLTGWFLIVVSFAALFVVTGKRHAETTRLGVRRATHRAALQDYTPAYTHHLLTLSSGVAIVAYCIWALEVAPDGPDAPWLMFSVVPFVTAMLRYALIVYSGAAGEPEEVLLKDRPLQSLALVWAACIGFGVYAS